MFSDVADLYATSPMVFTGSVFVLGLVIGSFLNVVIYRLPIMLEREWRAQAAEILPAAGGGTAGSANAARAPGRACRCARRRRTAAGPGPPRRSRRPGRTIDDDVNDFAHGWD